MADNANAAQIATLKEKITKLAAAGQKPFQYDSTLRTLRDLLYASITSDDLQWYTLDLKMGKRGSASTPYKIKVCAPVVVYGYFVPVTAKETWDMAEKFKAFPLTRAVVDQEVNEAIDKGNFVTCMPQDINTHGSGFDTFTDKLHKSKYSQIGSGPVQGSHKLWVLSSKITEQQPANYGFHHKGKRYPYAQGEKGPYLYPEYDVINGLIRAHDWNMHFDYSQLLQLMKGLQDSDGKTVDLARPSTTRTRPCGTSRCRRVPSGSQRRPDRRFAPSTSSEVPPWVSQFSRSRLAAITGSTRGFG